MYAIVIYSFLLVVMWHASYSGSLLLVLFINYMYVFSLFFHWTWCFRSFIKYWRIYIKCVDIIWYGLEILLRKVKISSLVEFEYCTLNKLQIKRLKWNCGITILREIESTVSCEQFLHAGLSKTQLFQKMLCSFYPAKHIFVKTEHLLVVYSATD